MRADEEMGAVARCAIVAVSSSASTETVYDEVAVATCRSCPLCNCSHFEQRESTETVGFGPLRRRLGAETGREPDEAMGAAAQLPAQVTVPSE